MNDEMLEWIEKAEQDFRMAQVGMRQRKNPVYDSVCFHAQQCAEKYLKAFLVRHKITFRKTHDLTELQRLCLKADETFQLLGDPLKRLYPYAIDIRYPGVQANVSEARQAINDMKVIRKFVRARLGLKTR